MLDYYVNNTQYINPAIYANYSPFESRPHVQNKQECQEALMEQTSFVTAEAKPVDLFAVPTGLLTPTSDPISQADTSVEQTHILIKSVRLHTANTPISTTNEEIDKIANQRVRLMAAKYAGSKESSEIVARLEILNRRLSERAPRVSKEQVTALEEANDQLVRIRVAREERAKRLGIPIKLWQFFSTQKVNISANFPLGSSSATSRTNVTYKQSLCVYACTAANPTVARQI